MLSGCFHHGVRGAFVPRHVVSVYGHAGASVSIQVFSLAEDYAVVFQFSISPVLIEYALVRKHSTFRD